jgi:hypothetical protein
MDIYAVGLLAYELLTGVSPFTGPSPRETLAAQLTRDPQPLHEVSGEVPRSLSDLIMRCLAKDPAARPQSADDILQELDSMTMPLGFTPQQGGIPKPRKRNRWASVAAVAILFAALASVGYVVTRQKGPTRPAATAPKTTARTTVSPESTVKRAAAAARIGETPARPVISHDDSVRIAVAVAKKIAASKAADSTAKARLAEETQRKMIDSIIAANSGGASGAAPTGPRRLIIAEPADIRGWPEATLLGRAVSDSLRRMLRPRARQFVPVDQDSVRIALSTTRDVGAIGRALNSDMLLSIRLTALPRDSALLIIQIYDLQAAGPFRSRAVGGRPVAKNEVLAGLDGLLLSTMTYLDEMSRAPRRPTVPGPPPPTGR